MTEAEGFAVVERGRLLVATVAVRDVDAMIHWLADTLFVPANAPETYVHRTFRQVAERRDAEVVPVTVLCTRGDRQGPNVRITGEPNAGP